MRYFRQRVVLIHKLRQLTGAEELFYGGGNRLRIDHLLWHQAISFCLRQALFDSTLNAHQADTECVLGHLTHASYTTVTKMIDIINRAKAVANIDQRRQDIKDVIPVEYAFTFRVIATNATIELHAANS